MTFTLVYHTQNPRQRRRRNGFKTSVYFVGFRQRRSSTTPAPSTSRRLGANVVTNSCLWANETTPDFRSSTSTCRLVVNICRRNIDLHGTTYTRSTSTSSTGSTRPTTIRTPSSRTFVSSSHRRMPATQFTSDITSRYSSNHPATWVEEVVTSSVERRCADGEVDQGECMTTTRFELETIYWWVMPCRRWGCELETQGMKRNFRRFTS